MSILFALPRQFVVDGAGSPRAGAKLFFYVAGTLTLQNTFSDDDLTTPNTNPVVADSSGTFGPIYLSAAAYRVILKDSADVQIWDQDDINTPVLGLFGSNVLTKSGNYPVVTDDKGKFIKVTATATITLPAVASAAVGFTLAIESSSTGTITIDPNASEQINGGSSLVLAAGEWCLITTDGSTWEAFVYDASRITALEAIPGPETAEAIAFSSWASSTTYTDIITPVSLEADTDYGLEFTFALNTDATPDFKFRLHTADTLTLDTNPPIIVTVIDETAGTIQGITSASALDSDFVIDGSTGDQLVTLKGTMQVNAAGTFSIQGAQNTSDPSSTEISAGGLFTLLKLR